MFKFSTCILRPNQTKINFLYSGITPAASRSPSESGENSGVTGVTPTKLPK